MAIEEGNDAEALATLDKANTAAAKGKAAPLQDLKALTGDVLVRSDRLAEAEMFYLDELKDFPHNLHARESLAALYKSMGQTDDAARVTSDLVRITPSPAAYDIAAKLWTSLGDRKQAAQMRADARRLFSPRRNAPAH